MQWLLKMMFGWCVMVGGGLERKQILKGWTMLNEDFLFHVKMIGDV